MTSCPSRVRSSSSASSLIASGVRSASRAASSSSCSFLNHARLFTGRRTGASLGAFFFHAADQRFLSACSGPTSKRNRTQWRETATLKWQCFLYPRASGLNATHVSSGGFTVRRACLATCANTSPPSERLGGGAVVDRRLHDQDLLGGRVDAHDAEHLGVERLPPERDQDDLEVVDVEHRGRAQAPLEPAEHRALVDEAAVGERAHAARH